MKKLTLFFKVATFMLFFSIFGNIDVSAQQSTFGVATANPTLSTVTVEPVCAGNSATVMLTGLIPGSTGYATFKIGTQSYTGTSSTASDAGTYAFQIGPLPINANGAYFAITKLTLDSGGSTSFSNKTATLVVHPKPTLLSVTAEPVCAGNSTNIVLTGLLPYSTGFATYKIGGQTFVGTSGTASADGTFTISTGVLDMSANGALFEITKMTSEFGCETTFTGKTTTLVVNPLPTVEITGNPIVCAGESFNLTASGGVSYAWTGPVGSKNGYSPAKYTSSSASISKSLNGLTQYHRIGEYHVTVTDANGCVNTASETVGVSPILTLNVLPVLPPACEGSNFTVNSVATINNVNKSNNFPYYSIATGNTNDITYAWSGPNGYTSSSSNASVSNASMNAAGNYSLTISTPQGCEKTASTNVTVNPNPTIELDATAAVCIGSDITLNATSNGTILSWFKNGNPVGLGSSLTITSADMSDAGVYTFRARNNSLCVAEQQIELVVNSLPVVTASSNSPICEGSSVNLSAEGGVSYAWNGPASFMSADQNPTFSANVNASGNYMVTVTDDNGCVNSANTDVLVNPLPTVEITGTPIVCAGESFSLTASGGVSYAWTGSVGSKNGFSSAKYTSSNASISRSLNGLAQYHRIGEYNVTVTDANGCVNTASETVGVSPILTLNVLPVLPPACEGSNFTVNSFATINNVNKSNNFPYYSFAAGNTNDITYAWSGPNGYTSSSSNASVSNASMNAAGNYSLTISTPQGCEKTASTNVTVNPNPTIELDATAAVCIGSDITLNATSNGTILSWFKNGNPVGLGSSLTITSADMSDAGVYTFRARNNSLCVAEQQIELVVNSLPTLSTVTAEATCEGNSTNIVLSGLVPNSTGFATYKVGGQTTQGTTGTASEDGTFTIQTANLPLLANGAIFEITKITNEFGCETNFTGKTVALVVHPKPTLSTVSAAAVCEGNSTDIVLSGLIPYSTGFATYTIGGQTFQGNSGTASSDGTFTIQTQNLPLAANGAIFEITKITNEFGCETNFTGKTVALVVHPKPTLTTVTAAPVYAGSPATIVLSGLISNSVGYATYKFANNAPTNGQLGTASSGGVFSITTPNLPILANGVIFEVTKMTSNHGCETSFTDKKVTLVVTQPAPDGDVTANPVVKVIADQNNPTFGIENQAKADFVMYPNPVNDILNIQTELDIQSVDFLNVNGQKVLSSNQKQINVSLLPAGIYMVRVQDKANNVVIKKVIVK